MVKKQIITKSKKYMLQFPSEVSTEDQKKYLQSVNDSFKESDLVVIDSKIKIYSKEEHFEKELPEDKEKKKEETADKPADKTEDKTEEKKEEVKEEKKEEKPENVKVEKVGTPKEPPKETTVEEELLGE